MKKAICIIVLMLLYFQKYEYVDLSQYESKNIQVEIKGEVQKPGVYTLPKKTSLKELLKKAKGVKKTGDTSSLHMNRVLMDKDIVVVGKKTSEEKVSLNSASKEQLTTLPGIGEAMANRIIEYRNTNSFKRIEDIMLIKGIKEKLFAKIKDRITL